MTGSFLLGLLYRYAADSAAITPELRAMLTIGLRVRTSRDPSSLRSSG